MRSLVALFCSIVGAAAVRANNGLPDVVIHAGSPLRLKIRSDALGEPVAFYRLSEAGGDHLPGWLQWDQREQTLLGLPESNDVGPYYISVDGYAAANALRRSVQDVFTIEVRRFGERECHRDDLGTHMLLVMDKDMEALGAIADRLRLLDAVNAEWMAAESGRASLLAWHDVSAVLARLTLSGEGDHHLLNPSTNRGQWSVRPRQAVVVYNFACRSAFSEHVATALANFKKRLLRNAQLLIAKRPPVSVTVAAWALADLRAPKAKRQAFYNDQRVVHSEYGRIGKSTDAFGTEIWITPEPMRPWFSVRPTSRIDYKPAVVTTTPAARSTSSSTMRTTARLETIKSVPDEPAPPSGATTATGVEQNRRPELRKSLGTVICYKGVLCEVRIPDDTFQDDEDGSTVTLRLSLKRLDHDDQPEWMYLHKLDRTLFGLSMETGQWHYTLTATDSRGEQVSDAFAIRVLEMGDHQSERVPPNHVITITLAEDFAQFGRRPSNAVKLVTKLANFLDEDAPTSILVRSIRAGSTVIEWSNQTLLRMDECPRSTIERQIVGRMQKRNGEVRREFVTFMRPEFTPKFVSVAYDGGCAVTSTDRRPTDAKPAVVAERDKTPLGAGLGSTTLMSTLIPALIIFVLLLVAGALICFYYKRSRRTAKQPEDSERKYLSKGTPIIFPDEVDAENECTAASPMLLKEEKAPLPVVVSTELSSFQPNGAAATTTTTTAKAAATLSEASYGRNTSSFDDGGRTFTDDGTTTSTTTTITNNPLYRPPPPFDTARMGSERSPKPKQAHPAFRQPPPYVPP